MPPAPDSIPASARRLRRVYNVYSLISLALMAMLLVSSIALSFPPSSLLSRISPTMLPVLCIGWVLDGLADWLILRQHVGEPPRLVLVGPSQASNRIPPLLTMTQLRVVLSLYCLSLAGAVIGIVIALSQEPTFIPTALGLFGITLCWFLFQWAKQWHP